MTNTASNLPAPLIDRYWFEVEWELRHRYQLAPQQASDAISQYRSLMAAAGVGDMLYHSDVAETAKVIADGSLPNSPTASAPKPRRSKKRVP